MSESSEWSTRDLATTQQFLQQNEPVRKRWIQLREEGRFSLEAATSVLLPIPEQVEMGRSLDQIYQNGRQLPSLGDEIKYMGEASATIKLIAFLNPLNMLAVGNNGLATDLGMRAMAEMILEDENLRRWKLVEFRILVQTAIKGGFGPIYGRIDAAVVYDWINKYATIRLQKIEDERIREQKKLESEQMDKKVAEKLSDALKKVLPETVTKAQTKHYSSPEHFIDDPDNALIVKEWSKDYSEMMGISLNDYLYTNAINLIKQTG